MEVLFGNHDENLRFLEQQLKVRIRSQGNELFVEGDPQGGADTICILVQHKHREDVAKNHACQHKSYTANDQQSSRGHRLKLADF